MTQGQSRRVQVEVRSVPDSGTMPLIAASVLSVSIGDVKVGQTHPSKGRSQWVSGRLGQHTHTHTQSTSSPANKT